MFRQQLIYNDLKKCKSIEFKNLKDFIIKHYILNLKNDFFMIHPDDINENTLFFIDLKFFINSLFYLIEKNTTLINKYEFYNKIYYMNFLDFYSNEKTTLEKEKEAIQIDNEMKLTFIDYNKNKINLMFNNIKEFSYSYKTYVKLLLNYLDINDNKKFFKIIDDLYYNNKMIFDNRIIINDEILISLFKTFTYINYLKYNNLKIHNIKESYLIILLTTIFKKDFFYKNFFNFFNIDKSLRNYIDKELYNSKNQHLKKDNFLTFYEINQLKKYFFEELQNYQIKNIIKQSYFSQY